MKKVIAILLLFTFSIAQAHIPAWIVDNAARLTAEQASLITSNMVLAAKNSVHMTSGEINAGNTAMVAAKNITFDAAVNTHFKETSHSKLTVAGLGTSLSKNEITLGGLEKTSTEQQSTNT